jgi:hypothetical protein
MERERNTPNQGPSNSKAEGEQWSSESDTVEQRDGPRNVDERITDIGESGGISNRPLDEEVHNQERLPERGESREGAHAGHGGPETNRTNRLNEEE